MSTNVISLRRCLKRSLITATTAVTILFVGTGSSAISVIVSALAQADLTITVSTTSRQTVLSYVAPDASPCTLEVSENNSYTLLINDVNSGLFAGANSDARAGSLGVGTTSRSFIVGTIPDPKGVLNNLALDSKRYGRALTPNTTYYARVTCGSDSGITNWTTSNRPLGITFAEVMPNDGAGNYAFPTTGTTDRTQTIIDPVYGNKIKLVNLPGDGSASMYFLDTGSQWACAQSTTNDSSGTPGYLCTLPTDSGTTYLYWINTANGDSRFLGQMVMTAGQLGGNFPVSYVSSVSSKFRTDPTKVVQIFFDNSRNAHVVQCQLPASGNSYYDLSVAGGSTTTCTWS